jgi:RHS repeat-associated protein
MEGTIGLQYFNARWYDSSLGRWAQPDSILPIASQGVQAWDRYEFTNNNSVNFADSTGHSVDCGLMESGCDHIPLADEAYTQPYHEDKDKLTEEGKKAKQYYEWMRANRGWWNNNTLNTFTVQQFLGLWILWEAAGYREGDIIFTDYRDAIAYQLFTDPKKQWKYPTDDAPNPYCSGEVCDNGMLNWIGIGNGGYLKTRFSPDALANPINHPAYTNDSYDEKNPEPLAAEAAAIGNYVLANRAKYSQADPWKSPFRWGNPGYPANPAVEIQNFYYQPIGP